ncbi:tRNA1(Val) (adenine(37)-N6)-methyltransferase [Alkalilacustris brevis]|uniref:tRNA1(Val) (adenine(37)-N6)-methyltransferase n=1 Tax=Alkalilacustris brevis TaxID=2026338 RepID=UPI000E0D42A9|nr:methyltransferase [Alkalilacustris brevis]
MAEAEGFAPEALTEDFFLGGRVSALQPRDGYRAATDPVLMAAAVPARAGESVLELGCGAGVASLCLAARVPGVRLAGVELQPAYAELARRNAARNETGLEVFEADISALPVDLRARSFDHVMFNPPWYSPDAPRARDGGRAIALQEATPLAAWVEVALRRLRPGGYLTVIQLAHRLPALLAPLSGRAGITVLPLLPRQGRPAKRIVLQARKGGRSAFRLLAPLVIHAAPRHTRDGEDLTGETAAILRDGKALLLRDD